MAIVRELVTQEVEMTAPVTYSRDELWLARHQPAVLEFIQMELPRSARPVAMEMVWRLIDSMERYRGKVPVVTTPQLEQAILIAAETETEPVHGALRFSLPLAIRPEYRPPVELLLRGVLHAVYGLAGSGKSKSTTGAVAPSRRPTSLPRPKKVAALPGC